jgi:hypothetical protein
MIAGTLAVLEEPAAEPLETATSGGTLPALDVRTTQTDLQGDAVAQQGHAGGTVRAQTEDVMVARTRDDEKEPIVVTERVEGREEHHTEWVADVTGHGIVLIGSLGGSDELPFPLDLMASQTDRAIQPTSIDLESLAVTWNLNDEQTWYTGDSDDDGTTLGYHDQAGHPAGANVGLGFSRSWRSTGCRGVVYESGYVAIYRDWTAAVAIKFVAEEILPHARADSQQQSLGDSADGGGR